MREQISQPITARPRVARLLRPFQQFFQTEASSGLVLLFCAVIALWWANSPWGSSYFRLWETPIAIRFGEQALTLSLKHWINDALMAIFFLVVGLEIKREVLTGELSSIKQSMLPVAAAIGGMVLPAGIYAVLNAGTPAIRGWGIPMATDIAFSLGVLALLGSRVPLGLKVFLTAFAIVDDIGAVLVIALFYSHQISWLALGIGGAILLLLMCANRMGARNPLLYIVLGLGLWLAFLLSGVHATVAGVLLAFTIPATARIDARQFLTTGKDTLEQFEEATPEDGLVVSNETQQSAVHTLEEACEQVQTPLQRMEHALHPMVVFFIMPLFALANAGVNWSSGLDTLTNSLTLGVVLGLIFGKQIGITLFSWASVKMGLSALPAGVTWRHVYGVSWLGGIGFTMSLFIAELAFRTNGNLEMAKVGILTASLIAGIGGYLLLRGAPSIEEDANQAG